MRARPSFEFKRGRLTAADHETIERLAGDGWKSSRIAKEIRRHPSTVAWYMYVTGLKAPAGKGGPGATYVRNGRVVRKFSADEDLFIETLRIQDFTPAEIAAHVNSRFGTERTHHTVRCRLVMLAAREVA